MKYGFNVYKTQVEDHVFWVAESKDLKGCVGQGETLNEALEELECNEQEWLETATECGIDIPLATVEKNNQYSGKFVVRVSAQIHKEATENSSKQGISLNQYVNNAILVSNTATTTADALKGIVGEFKAIMFHSANQLLKNDENTFLYETERKRTTVTFNYQNTAVEKYM